MVSLKKFVLLSVFSSAALAAVAAEPKAEVEKAPESDASFQELLRSIDEDSIHEAIHSLSDKFRHGVFHRDSKAVEALHKEDAPLATVLLHLAKRRAESNSTVSTPTSVTPTSQDSTSSQQTASSASTATPVPPTSDSSSAVEPTSSPSSSSESSSSEGSSSDSSSSETPSSSPSASSTPGTTAATTSSDSTSSPASSSSAAAASTASSSFVTSTSSNSGAVTSASSSPTKTQSPYTSTYKSTTTLPNGSLSTVTAVTVVHPTEAVAATAAATGSPSLQQNVAATTMNLKREALVMLGGAMAVAMAL
ncbi:GPI anchored protein, putative [Paecilomyces variotii No. 5]|uniref:GPI anchored protein, putative n=1 Tax=Byssochlamys spectabilis (strain No. 5 / NBRC 109023) TaxID=1356009 RepID=V5FZX9_BYSSN|nr:GPI anchored protein, putative [Paecilomyces variotii No. 5]